MKVFALVRVSTTEQSDEDRGGIPRQRAVINKIAEREGLDVVETVEIVDVSGTEVRRSPEFQRILAAIRNRSVKGVVVADLDRLFRPENLGDFDILEVFRAAGATIFTEYVKHDFSSPDGTFMTQVLAAFAGLERSTILKRTQGAKEAKRKMGFCPSAEITLPRGVGYDRKTNMWSYTPDVAQVSEAFRIIDEEGILNVSEVARRVGIQHATLRNLLRNPIYTGWRIYDQKRGEQKYQSQSGGQADRKKVSREEQDVIRVKVIEKGAVSDEQFARVQMMLDQTRTQYRSSRETKEINLLSGIAVCGFCGARLYASSGRRKNGTKQGYYYCRENHYLQKRNGHSCEQQSVKKQDLEKTVIDFVGSYLADPAIIARIIAKIEEAASDQDSQKDLEHRLRVIDKSRSRLIDAIQDGTISIEELRPRIRALDQEKQAIMDLMADSELRSQSASTLRSIVRRLIRGAHKMSHRLSKMEQRIVLQSMFESITFHDCSIVDFKLNGAFVGDVLSPEPEDVITPQSDGRPRTNILSRTDVDSAFGDMCIKNDGLLCWNRSREIEKPVGCLHGGKDLGCLLAELLGEVHKGHLNLHCHGFRGWFYAHIGLKQIPEPLLIIVGVRSLPRDLEVYRSLVHLVNQGASFLKHPRLKYHERAVCLARAWIFHLQFGEVAAGGEPVFPPKLGHPRTVGGPVCSSLLINGTGQ